MSEPRVLYSIPNIRAFHVQDGQETSLTPSRAQTMSMLMVPTSSPFYESDQAQNDAEDFYLHLHLPPELDLPLPAATQIYHQPPNSYLIPRWDLGPERGAFTRIEFPGVGSGPEQVSREDVDTFESILAQCTAFLEKAPPPPAYDAPNAYAQQAEPTYQPYNPSTYAAGPGYGSSEKAPLRAQSASFAGPSSSPRSTYGGSGKLGEGHDHGQIVLIDEENGSVIGELSHAIVEDSEIKPGTKDPVEVSLPDKNTSRIQVRPAMPETIEDLHPAYKNSGLIQRAGAASRLIMTTSEFVSNKMLEGADMFKVKVKPNEKPMSFSPAAQARARKVQGVTAGAAGLSSKAVDQVSKYAQNAGAILARKGNRADGGRGVDKDGKPIDDFKPGILNKSMMAFSTVADGVAHAGKSLLESSGSAATTVVAHKFGNDAGQMAASLTSGVKNVGLVYIDATGVSRRAIIKSVAKGMVVGKFRDGSDIIVGSQGDFIHGDKPGPSQPSVNIGQDGGQWPAPPAYTSDNSLYDRPEKSNHNTYQ